MLLYILLPLSMPLGSSMYWQPKHVYALVCHTSDTLVTHQGHGRHFQHVLTCHKSLTQQHAAHSLQQGAGTHLPWRLGPQHSPARGPCAQRMASAPRPKRAPASYQHTNGQLCAAALSSECTRPLAVSSRMTWHNKWRHEGIREGVQPGHCGTASRAGVKHTEAVLVGVLLRGFNELLCMMAQLHTYSVSACQHTVEQGSAHLLPRRSTCLPGHTTCAPPPGLPHLSP